MAIASKQASDRSGGCNFQFAKSTFDQLPVLRNCGGPTDPHWAREAARAMVASGSGLGSGSGYANYTAMEIDTVFNMGVACGWGLVSALSLIIGAAIGIVAKPGPW